MSTLVIDAEPVRAQSIEVDGDSLKINLVEGRSIIVPIAWYPRLWYGTPEERSHYCLLYTSDAADE